MDTRRAERSASHPSVARTMLSRSHPAVGVRGDGYRAATIVCEAAAGASCSLPPHDYAATRKAAMAAFANGWRLRKRTSLLA
jgi:hypothetical protein